MGYPKMEGFLREKPIKIDDLGLPPVVETPIHGGRFDLWPYIILLE